jgi:hypothetical protein
MIIVPYFIKGSKKSNKQGEHHQFITNNSYKKEKVENRMHAATITQPH